MLNVSPVAKYLQNNSAQAKLLTDNHYYGQNAFSWVKKSNFVDKNNGNIIGNITSVGQQRGDTATHRVIVNLPDMTEIRSQRVKLVKVKEENCNTDRFIPEQIVTEIKTIEKGKEPVVQKIERVLISKLQPVFQEIKSKLPTYSLLDSVKYAQRFVK